MRSPLRPENNSTPPPARAGPENARRREFLRCGTPWQCLASPGARRSPASSPPVSRQASHTRPETKYISLPFRATCTVPGPSAACAACSTTSPDGRLIHPPRIDPFALQLLGERRHAVVGRQRHNVFDPLPTQRVEAIEENANRLVQVHVHVLDLLAARTEGMAHQIGRRKAHAEHVGRAVLAEPERFDQRRGEVAEIGVGVRAALPLRRNSASAVPLALLSAWGNVASILSAAFRPRRHPPHNARPGACASTSCRSRPRSGSRP